MKPQLPATLAALALAACSGPVYRDRSVTISAVTELDIARYAGLWYEIARFPVSFEEGCVAVTAEYTPRADGTIGVLNSCRQGGFDGETETAEATARIAAPGELKVKFLSWLPIEGDYWVLYVSPDYDLAAVGNPGGGSGWILARDPHPAPEAVEAGRDALAAAGYDTAQLIMTPQP